MKSASFRFSLNDLCPQNRVRYTKRIDKMEMCLRLIEAYRFTLEQDSFDLIRLRYSDALIIIRHMRTGSCEYNFEIRYY